MTTFPPSPCCSDSCSSSSEVPLLSQDEFFRHLQLQSVHITKAKFTYRQALKERLRANPKKVLPAENNNTVAPKATPGTPVRSKSRSNSSSSAVGPAVTPHISPKWLSPKSCRRIFGRPKVRKEKKALNFEAVSLDQPRHPPSTATTEPTSLLTECLTKNAKTTSRLTPKTENDAKVTSILGPLINNCHLYRHPKVTEEIEAFGLAKKRRKENPGEAEPERRTILERRDYLAERQARRERKKPTRATVAAAAKDLLKSEVNKIKTEDLKEYEPAIRIQPGARATGQEEEGKNSPLFKLLNPPSVMLQKKTDPMMNVMSKGSKKASMPPPTIANNPRLVHPLPPSIGRCSSPALLAAAGQSELRCRHCDRVFASRAGLAFHEENGHQTTSMIQVCQA